MSSRPISCGPLDDGHVAAKPPTGLRQFEAGISAADHDQMRRHVVEFERLDMGHWLGSLHAWNARNGGVGADIEEDPLAGQQAHAAVVETHFERLRRHKAPAPHDQFRAARGVVPQMLRHLVRNHVAFALADRRHVDGDRTGRDAVLRGMTDQMGDLGAADLILARHAGDIRTGAANPPPLDHGGSSPRFRHVPGYELAADPLPRTRTSNCSGSDTSIPCGLKLRGHDSTARRQCLLARTPARNPFRTACQVITVRE